ncbi:hypothetical protein C8A03DRAFT_39425 [Achaetomium macrosporum]|uniref:G-protein coupled receptors family 2 profile 2 domain-containing protein n=1 Tax=Achaetomium macrosporum TaxID=79813 RepID=A0AAN7C1P3_9PEZI|nr:hypothetical protein C8A03DRAFT_39425 [Achaetomium macrosporum]
MLHIRGNTALDAGQQATLTAVTRAASTLSALGVITIIATFAMSKHFRNPMHRLIVINAFYNALDVVCTMISTSGPDAGNGSALCQFQGFLNQMFPLADVFWTLAMAVNVFLIVHRSYDVESLRSLEWKYMVVITTVTFIPAFVLLFINTEDKGPMYGSVTLWCAIAPKWILFRIILYYVPIWSSILVTVVLYLAVGIEIAKRRRFLDSTNSHLHAALEDTNTVPPPLAANHDSCSNSTTAAEYTDGCAPHHSADSVDDGSPIPTSTATGSKHYAASTTPLKLKLNLHLSSKTTPTASSSLSFRQYILMPLFFFIALLLVWVAPSTNRVAAFVDPSFASYPLLLVVGATGSLRGFWNGIVFVVVGMRSWKRRKKAKVESDEIALRPVVRSSTKGQVSL